jgi:hypothetical protein
VILDVEACSGKDSTEQTALSSKSNTQLSPDHRFKSFRNSGRFQWVALLLPFCLATVYRHAQATNGAVTGMLNDPRGSVIPNAPMTLEHVGKADTRTATTNDSGFYQFNNLPCGQYRIVVKQAGFKQLTQAPVDLQVDSTLQINLALTLESATEEVVTVQSSTPLIQVETASLGRVIDQRQTNEIPLNGRNAMNLVALAQNPNSANPLAWGSYQLGGGLANQSVTYLDGAPVNTGYITSLVPTPASLQEFKAMLAND